jgi:predicted molibdopterin-dependent oxidoreductase YjgC
MTGGSETFSRFKRINSKQRIGLIKKVSRAPGQALSDFNIFKLVAHYWGCEKMFEKWSSPQSVFQILKELSRDQPCDITGIRDYQMIDNAGGIQCPLPDTSNDAAASKDEPAPGLTISVQPERRLFEDGLFYHSVRKARFLFETPGDAPELADNEYSFVLLTGRGTVSQWHTQTRTGKACAVSVTPL